MRSLLVLAAAAPADPDVRLGRFHARTPYFDDQFLLYPVGREPAG